MIDISAILLQCAIVRPYYARAFAALTPVASERVSTVAVSDRWHLLYSPTWLAGLSEGQRVGVVAGHEIEHLLRDHAGRRLERDAFRWNVACDLEVNDGCDLDLPDNVCLPTRMGLPRELLAEEYYDQLPESAQPSCSGGSGVGEPVPGEDDLPDGVPAGSPSEDLRDAVAADVRDYERGHPGTVPRGVAMWAGERARGPRLSLPRLVARSVRSALTLSRGRSAYSWTRPARRLSAVLRPATVDQHPRVAVVVDTSGSMHDAGPRALAAVRSAVRSYDLAGVVVCDAAVHSITRTIPRTWQGGGGTDMCAAISAASELHADAIVVVSDCETPWPDAPPAVPVIAVRIGSGGTVPRWAREVRG